MWIGGVAAIHIVLYIRIHSGDIVRSYIGNIPFRILVDRLYISKMYIYCDCLLQIFVLFGTFTSFPKYNYLSKSATVPEVEYNKTS
jgi:hypothetical protein